MSADFSDLRKSAKQICVNLRETKRNKQIFLANLSYQRESAKQICGHLRETKQRTKYHVQKMENPSQGFNLGRLG